MPDLSGLIERARQTQHGFGDIKKAAEEVLAAESPADALAAAHTLFQSDVEQARMLAVFIFGHFAAADEAILQFMRETVSRDADWRVQEILAQAFDQSCKDRGYEESLPLIQDWLADAHHNVRRAVSEGLRIWTTRPYFKQHPETAIQLLSNLRADDSDYVRKSVGNALRDISRKHAPLVEAELATWDLSNKATAQTYKLAAKFISEKD